MRYALLAMCCTLAALTLAAVAQPAARVTVGIPYGTGQRQRLDLWRPPTCPPNGCPSVVWLHGHGGSRTLVAGAVQLRLLRSGVAVASCDYRTGANGDADSTSLADAKRCRAWISSAGGPWELDPARVGCWGASLGGYLCNWLAMTCGDTVTGSGVAGECVRGGVALFGASRLPTIDGELAALGCPPYPRPQLSDTLAARRASPLEYAGPESPPWFGLASRDDCVVPYLQTLHLDSALRATGGVSVVRIFDGIGHGGPAWQADSIVNPQLKFLRLVVQ